MSPHSPSLSLAPRTRWDSTLDGSRSSRERPDHAPQTPAHPEQRQCPKEKKRVTISSKSDGCHHPQDAPAHSPQSGNCCQMLQSNFLVDPGREGEKKVKTIGTLLARTISHAVLPALLLPTLRDVPTSTLSCTSPSGIAAARHALRRLYTASVTLGGSMKERRSHSSRTQDTTDCTSVGMLTGEA